jgi:hypothetical protein
MVIGVYEIEDSKKCKVVDTVKTITIDDIFSNYNLEYLDLLKLILKEVKNNCLKVIMKTGYPKRNVSLLNYMMEVLKEAQKLL